MVCLMHSITATDKSPLYQCSSTVLVVGGVVGGVLALVIAVIVVMVTYLVHRYKKGGKM